MNQKHRNKTGLYVAQGMYIPSQDKRAVIPPMLYRGHVVSYTYIFPYTDTNTAIGIE